MEASQWLVLIDGDVAISESLNKRNKVRNRECRGGFAGRTEFMLDTQVHLQAPPFELASAAFREVRWFGDLGDPKQA